MVSPLDSDIRLEDMVHAGEEIQKSPEPKLGSQGTLYLDVRREKLSSDTQKQKRRLKWQSPREGDAGDLFYTKHV